MALDGSRGEQRKEQSIHLDLSDAVSGSRLSSRVARAQLTGFFVGLSRVRRTVKKPSLPHRGLGRTWARPTELRAGTSIKECTAIEPLRAGVPQRAGRFAPRGPHVCPMFGVPRSPLPLPGGRPGCRGLKGFDQGCFSNPRPCIIYYCWEPRAAPAHEVLGNGL